MMAESPQLVVDASVAVAELLRSQDEPYTDIARQVFTHFHEGRIRLIAPEHIRIEVGHALLRAVRRRRISAQQGANALDLFYVWELETVRHTGCYWEAGSLLNDMPAPSTMQDILLLPL